MEENILYYERRLEFLLKIYREEGMEVLGRNIDKIKALVDRYKLFQDKPSYDLGLVGAVETFVLQI